MMKKVQDCPSYRFRTADFLQRQTVMHKSARHASGRRTDPIFEREVMRIFVALVCLYGKREISIREARDGRHTGHACSNDTRCLVMAYKVVGRNRE